MQPPDSLKSLSDPIYETFYGLKEQPFAISTDPKFLFLSAPHRRAYDELMNGITRDELIAPLSAPGRAPAQGTRPLPLTQPTSVVAPPFPPNVMGSGKVILESDISSRGAVTAVRIVSPPSAFDGAAADTARQWKYRPATRQGKAVESRAFLVFSFAAVS